MRVETAVQWAKASASVAAGAALGFLAGTAVGHPWVGTAGGAALGMGVNWRRQCHVCMEHMRAMEAMIDAPR